MSNEHLQKNGGLPPLHYACNMRPDRLARMPNLECLAIEGWRVGDRAKETSET
jgi:hypothetical protein